MFWHILWSVPGFVRNISWPKMTFFWTEMKLNFIFFHPVYTAHCLCAFDAIHAPGLWIKQSWEVLIKSAPFLLAFVPSIAFAPSPPLLAMQPICDLPFIASLPRSESLPLSHTYSFFPLADTCFSHLHYLTFPLFLHTFSSPPLSFSYAQYKHLLLILLLSSLHPTPVEKVLCFWLIWRFLRT